MIAALEGGEWSAARPGRTLPPGKTQYPFYRRLGGATGPVWTGEKSRPHRDSIPDHPARSSVSIPTELPGQHVYNNWYLLFFLDEYLLSWLDWIPIQPGQQMMGLDTPETCRGWRNILRISCASSWYFFTRFYRDARSKNTESNKIQRFTTYGSSVRNNFYILWFLCYWSASSHTTLWFAMSYFRKAYVWTTSLRFSAEVLLNNRP